MTNLFDPIRVGRLTLPNRVIMAPLTRGRTGAEGVDGLGNTPPSSDLRIVVDARRVAPAAALRVNGGGF